MLVIALPLQEYFCRTLKNRNGGTFVVAAVGWMASSYLLLLSLLLLLLLLVLVIGTFFLSF